MSGLAIETRGLTRLFDGKPAVLDLDLRVPGGAFYGFLGPNGAGKSTTMKMLTGLLRPTGGSARVLGVDLSGDALAVKARIGVVPDGLALFERLSGEEMLRIHGQLYGLPRPVAARRAGELLEALELTGEGGKLVQDYSHGMKKKLALGCALIHGPELLFLDEPFEGIDAIAVAGIRAMLQDLVARRSLTIFLTSHVLEVVERLVTHVGIIHRGRLVAQGTLEEVRASGSLEESFIRIVGDERRGARGLSWLGGGAEGG
jgi:ABC-2 type transport system ATP-binding protein